MPYFHTRLTEVCTDQRNANKESGCIKKVNQIKSTLIQWGFDQNIACEGISCTWKNLSSLFVFDRAAYKFV